MKYINHRRPIWLFRPIILRLFKRFHILYLLLRHFYFLILPKMYIFSHIFVLKFFLVFYPLKISFCSQFWVIVAHAKILSLFILGHEFKLFLWLIQTAFLFIYINSMIKQKWDTKMLKIARKIVSQTTKTFKKCNIKFKNHFTHCIYKLSLLIF